MAIIAAILAACTLIHISNKGMTVYNIIWDTDDNPEVFAELPQKIKLPKKFRRKYYKDNTERIEDISDWLSNAYGFCHSSFEIR